MATQQKSNSFDIGTEDESMDDNCSEVIISSDIMFETVVDAILGNRSCWSDKQKLYLIGLLSS